MITNKDQKVGGTTVEPLFQDFIEEAEENQENTYSLRPSLYKTGVKPYTVVFRDFVFITDRIKSMFTFFASSIYGSW